MKKKSRESIMPINTVRDLKKYLEDFDDNEELDEICIHKIEPTAFDITVSCKVILNADNVHDAEKIFIKKLRNTFGQKINLDVDSIDCEETDW